MEMIKMCFKMRWQRCVKVILQTKKEKITLTTMQIYIYLPITANGV